MLYNKSMQKIVPHLWFDTEAKPAAEFYASVFPDAKIISHTVMRNTPSGDCDVMKFEIMGYTFMSISAGPYFMINPSISFMVTFDEAIYENARTLIDSAWEKLVDGGKIMMELDTYPFSERYGWVEDKFGVSWQLSYTSQKAVEIRPNIIPSMLFTGKALGNAKAARDFYCSVFKNAAPGTLVMSPSENDSDTQESVMYSDFQLEGQWFAAMDSARDHDFAFSEAVSFIVNCDTQAEIDYYWEKLSAVPEAEQCGWLKDKFGVSWQITPTAMITIMQSGTPEQIDRVVKAFLPMKKFDIATLEAALKGTE